MSDNQKQNRFRFKSLLNLVDATFFRFIFVGIINAIVGTSTMFLLFNCANFSYWASSMANYIAGGTCSFFLNKYFTYRVRADKDAAISKKLGFTAVQAVKFITAVLVSYFVSYYCSRLVAHSCLPMLSEKWQDNIAMLGGTCGYSLINYFLTRFWVFRKKEMPEVASL